jgi:glucose/arabinose dehydrogenase
MMKTYLSLLLAVSLSACQNGNAAPQTKDVAHSSAQSTIHTGADIFAAQCASCHGAGGMGGDLFDDDWVYGGSDSEILTHINKGILDAGMPAFEGTLSDKEQAELLGYLKTTDPSLLSRTRPITNVPSVEDQVNIEDWATGLDEPWGFVFIGANEALVTEKTGELLQITPGSSAQTIRGIPEVNNAGQGGLLDVAIDPDYVDNGWVYLAFSHDLEPGSKKAMTKIVRGQIKDGVWSNEQTLFAARDEHYTKRGYHYGSRITFDAKGHLFFSIGDRGIMDDAQDFSKPNGKIHRINRDGSIPDDNPFIITPDAYPSIWSYGNRNPQGLIIHPKTGELWETEHGPKGGDELNLIKPGVNYGWPEISYGRNYSGTELTPHTALPGMAQPASQWTPSIAVCGLDVYQGEMFPEWNGYLMAGALAYQTVRLIETDAGEYVREVTLIEDKGRVRDVTTGPDGAIYVALPNKIVRITPKP